MNAPLFVSASRRLALAFVFSVVALVSVATAQTYTTFNYVIPLNQVGTVDGATIGAQPGWVIGIEAGTRSTLDLTNFHGTSSQPIIFVNKGGRVRIGPGAKRGIKVTGSSHFQIRGDNDPAHKYGIEVFKATGSTVEITALSTDFELCFMEIWGSGFAGIMAKTDPGAGGYASRGTFTQYNTIIHDNYLHDHPGEALYIGNSYWASGDDVGGTIYYPHDLVGTRIYNNLVDMSGREGIQVGSASSDCEIYNNVILNSGLLNIPDQRGGMQMGEGTTGKCYNNVIVNAPGNGLILLGQGDRLIANNVIANIGFNAIFCDDRYGTEIPGAHVRIVNNTIINYGNNCYLLFNQYTDNEFKNNLITSVPSGYQLINNSPGGTDPAPTYTSSNNVVDVVANLGLVNPANLDYRIVSTSPAVNAGTNLTSVGVTTDLEGLARPFGIAYDVGAFEYGALSVHLASENASIYGAADGSITVTPLGGTAPYTYAWADGPTTATRTGLPRGTYTVTVTDSASHTVTRTIRLIEPNELRVVSTRVSPAFAGSADGTAAITLDGGTPSYTVTWSNSATGASVTGLAAGFYGYTVTDANGDVKTGTVFIRDGGTPVYRINAGGLQLTDAHLNWASDKQGAPSSYRISGSNNPSGSDQNYTLPNPTEGPNNLFNNRRPDSAGGSEMSWEFPVTNGYYEVDLFFNEYNATGAGQRVFDVQLEGATVLDDFDLYALNGNIQKPTQRSFLVHITDGVIDLDFLHGAAGDPIINGIAIYSFGTTLPTGFPLYRINNGGIAQTTPPLNWALDKQSTPSSYLYAGGGLTTGSNTWNSGGTNTTDAPDNIFGSRRYDPAYTTAEMQWRFPVAPGLYRVNLYFIENDSTVTGAGQHKFDVTIEGSPFLTNYDLYAQYGWLMPAQEIRLLWVTDGTLNIDFLHVSGAKDPVISGIAINRLQ